MLPSLRQALASTSWRLLKIIGRQRGLSYPSNIGKAELVDRLEPVLPDPTSLKAVLGGLSEMEHQALATLSTAGGRLPRHQLDRRFGSLAGGGELLQKVSSSLEALSALERLVIKGLLFYEVETDDFVIPDDLISRLPVPSPPPAPAVAAPESWPPVERTVPDLALLLALLQRDDVAPLHGRWLPPRLLAAWGRYSRVRPARPQARSELQTGRRRFLHYLAENAGWLPPGGEPLKPTPAAWLWLSADRPARRQALWQSWTRPDPDRWRAYRLPGHEWLAVPAALLEPVHRALPEIDPAHLPGSLLQQQPELLDLVPGSVEEPPDRLAETIAGLLAGPLRWLGVLAEDGLAPVGQAWLTGQPPVAEVPPPAKFSISSRIQPDPFDSSLALTPGHGLPDPAELMVALEVSNIEEGEDESKTPPAAYSLRLTSASFIKALHQGWSAPALVEALGRLAERPLTGQEKALLRRWAEAADRMTLRSVTLLETADPQVISRLASARRGRGLIQGSLSPRAVIVDPARLDQLVRRLVRQEGVPPRRVGQPGSLPPLSLSLSEAAHLWLAVQVYRELGRLVRLPVRIPQAVLDRLAAGAGSEQLAAAEGAAARVRAELEQVITGRAIFPPWPEEGLPLQESLPVIEQALAKGHALWMSYYSAGRDELTRRLVEPYRVEWRGDTAYLVGFCHRAQAERVFRLDRIQRLGPGHSPER